jgi:hypothetical protein
VPAILHLIYVRRARIWFVICALSISRPLDWVDMKKERCNRSLRRIPIFGVASCFRGRIRSVKGKRMLSHCDWPKEALQSTLCLIQNAFAFGFLFLATPTSTRCILDSQIDNLTHLCSKPPPPFAAHRGNATMLVFCLNWMWHSRRGEIVDASSSVEG